MCATAFLLYATSAHAQLMDDWLVRTSASPDALSRGATAVFRNPALLSPEGRGEALLMEMRGPDISGISGIAGAASYRLDSKTSIGIGYQHIGVDGVELTLDAPDEGTELVIGQDLLAGGAAHTRGALTVGAGAQYLHSSEQFNQPSLLRLGAGFTYAPPFRVPFMVAASGQSQESHTIWTAGAGVMPRLPFEDWAVSAMYGASGSDVRVGVSHRVTAEAVWRKLVAVQGGVVSEPENSGRVMTAIGSIGLKVNRYELGVVRESLANGFGAVHTFRIGMVF
jgi:hypothetical protein